jgi:shikimate kinase
MRDQRIVIVGFMACGKTTVAAALAQRLGCSMIDLDSFVTEREGRSPAEIIEQDGEAAFREIETRAFADALAQTDAKVIALGGGAWIISANRALVAQNNCLSVWLDAPFDLCWERITSSGDTVRPLAPDRERAQMLYTGRRAGYQLAGMRVDAGRERSVAEIVDQVEKALIT